jgi:acyl carrier protein
MSNNEKLIEAFASGLQIDRSRIVDDLTYNTIKEWDSIAHMAVVAEIEQAFDIMLDTNDIIDMSTVAKTREILGRYDVDF